MTIENLLWLGGGIAYGISAMLIFIVIGGASQRPMATLNRARQLSISRWKMFLVGVVLVIIGLFITTAALADDWTPARQQYPVKTDYTEYHVYLDLGVGYVFDDSTLGSNDHNFGNRGVGIIELGIKEHKSGLSISALHISDPTEKDHGLNMVQVKKRFDFGALDFGHTLGW